MQTTPSGSEEKDYKRLVKKFSRRGPIDVTWRDNAHHAVQLFSNYVITNRNLFQERENEFVHMIRAYLNILEYVPSGNKKTLYEVLTSLPKLDSDLIDDIRKLSKHGRYMGISRALRRQYAARGRWAFLDMIGAFNDAGSKHDLLYGKLDVFKKATWNFGPAFLTGIASALRPEKFMVYNTRSVFVLKDTPRYKKLASKDMSRYREFNELYVRISDDTGRLLVELDDIAERYYSNHV